MNDAIRHLRSTHARFNRGAERYDDFAAVQRSAAADLVARLADLEEPLRILDAGCGSGLLTRELLGRFPLSRIDAFDISEAMLDVAQRALPTPRVRWYQSDFCTHLPPLPYPLVASSASLHWAPSLSEAVRHLADCVAPSGCLALSLMVEGTLRELRQSLYRAVAAKPPRETLPAYEDVLLLIDQLGFRRLSEGQYDVVSRHAGAMDLLRALHAQGLTGGTKYRPTWPLTRAELRRLAAEYERSFPAAGGGVTATYSVGWVVARRLD